MLLQQVLFLGARFALTLTQSTHVLAGVYRLAITVRR
jgi:hypothetical protein